MTNILDFELTAQEIASKMNHLGAKRQPFLFIVDYRAEKGYVWADNELDESFVRFSMNITDAPKSDLVDIQWEVHPVSFQRYTDAFNLVQNEIKQGNSFLVNLTQPSRLTTNLSLDALYENSKAKYMLWLKNRFVVLSPECFVKIHKNMIYSYPMKGTIDAAVPDAKNVILNDAKEMAEHATIVDLIRNDLSMVADGVEVKRYRYIDRLQTNKGDLLQISSEIAGILPEDFHARLGDILFKLLPAGSICGAPKPKTLEIIEQAEAYRRNYYTGVFGHYDGQDLDSAVMIRFVEQDADGLLFKSGGGITSQSNCESEYNELIRKVYVQVR